jgi:hypothetical protein
MSLRVTGTQRLVPRLRTVHKRGHLPQLPSLRPGNHPLPAPHPLQSLKLAMLGVSLSGLRQQIGQHAIRKVLRPTHRLRDTGKVLNQAVDDLLRRRGHRWRPLQAASIEHMFDSTL